MSDIETLDEKNIMDADFDINETSLTNKISFIDKISNYFLKLQNIGIKEKIIFYRLLSTMINAGMSLIKGVEVLERQEKNKVFKFMLKGFLNELREGKKLSDCLELHPKSFDRAEIGVVKSGEKTGKLNEILTGLANQIEKIASISGKLKGAMIYPSMVLTVVFGVIFVMMTMVVPKLLEIFDDKTSLPQSTQVLIMISDVFRNYWYLIILFIVVFIIFFNIWKKTPKGKYIHDKYILYIPVFGGIIQKVVLSKFSRVFSGLVSSGVSIVESLKIVSDAVGNEAYRQRILLLKEDVKGGMKMWESLDGDKLFPDMMIQMIQVGEQSAKLDQTIVKVADFYDEQVDNTISAINKLLEPFIIVFLAIVVGFIAVAIMEPIMGLADTISTK